LEFLDRLVLSTTGAVTGAINGSSGGVDVSHGAKVEEESKEEKKKRAKKKGGCIFIKPRRGFKLIFTHLSLNANVIFR
jgi:hypothetical protein